MPNNPTFYVWGSYPEAPNSPNTYTPWTTKVRKIVQVNLTDCLYPNGNCGGTLFYNHPELLAVRVAQDIYNEVGVYGRLTNDTVAVLLQNFAYDSNYHDRPKGVAEPTLGGARFFTVNDRLNNLIGEWQFDPQPHYPTRRSEDPLQYANREAFDFGSARSYRHPFIENARPGAPFQAWMQTFVDALEQQYQTRLTSGQPIPNPKDYIWTFDVEPIFLAEAGPNGVWFLDYLADPAQYGDTTHTYWNNPAYKVPGTNKTLQELYNDYRIANNLTGWPIDNPKTVLCAPGNTNFSYFHVNNAAFLMWYHELCLAVKDQVLSRCFHGVLQAKWGDANHRVRTSNYGDMTVDGAKDVYGWTLDRPWNTSVTLSNQNNTVTSWTPTEKSNRWQWHKARGGPRYYLQGYVNEPLDEQKRMLDAITVSSGAVDTIVAYPLAGTEIDWLDGPGHRRPNVYHPAQAWETDVQTAIRLYRQQAESIVNTIAPANSRNPSREVAAWMGMPRSILNGDGEDAFYPYISRKTARNLLAMFRGKNIKESMYYTDSGGIPLTEFEDAWNQMQRTVVEVYSTRVRKYTRTFAQGFASSYEDAGETQQQKASRLEFTLRDNAQNPPVDREVRLNSKLIPVTYPTPSTVHQTVLTVDLDWIDTTYMEDMTQYEINIECSIEFTGENAQRVRDASDFGEVQLWHSDGNGSGFYDTVNDNWPGVYAPTYTFNAPKSLGDNRYRMRIQFLTTYVDGSVFADASTGNIPTTRLRLRHQSPFAFISRYDLVQVIPTHEVSNPLGGQAFAANSDMNHDGVVDPTDLSIYLDEWMMDSPAADFDSDESVTGEDVDAFVEAYVNGT